MLLAMGVTSFPKVIASSVWIVSVQSKVANAFLPTANYLMSQQNTLTFVFVMLEEVVMSVSQTNSSILMKKRIKPSHDI